MDIEDAEQYFAKICRTMFADDCTPEERARRLKEEIEDFITSDSIHLSKNAKLKDISVGGCKVYVELPFSEWLLIKFPGLSALLRRKILIIAECFAIIDLQRHMNTNLHLSKQSPRRWRHRNYFPRSTSDLTVCRRNS